MRVRRPFDASVEDSLLSGRLSPKEAPPRYAEVAALFEAAAAPATREELAREHSAVTAIAAAVRATPHGTMSPAAEEQRVPRSSRLPRLRAILRPKLAAVAVAGAIAGATGAAAAGVLPGPIQEFAHDVLARIGISVPSGEAAQADRLVPGAARASADADAAADGRHDSLLIPRPEPRARGTAAGSSDSGGDHAGSDGTPPGNGSGHEGDSDSGSGGDDDGHEQDDGHVPGHTNGHGHGNGNATGHAMGHHGHGSPPHGRHHH